MKNIKKNDPWMRWLAIAAVLAMVAWAAAGRFMNGGRLGVEDTSVGGAFELVDHLGQTRTDKDFLGRYPLVYFGYTHCPDICPSSLQIVSDALDLLPEPVVARIAPIMISVDPERDSPRAMADYVVHFHPALVGLTGSLDQVRSVTRAYNIYAQKADDNDAYTMDHTSLLFLMGPDGKYLARFTPAATSEMIAQKLAELVSPGAPRQGGR
ncbi:MAG: SCO family protein [Alphaproteobacteria bacterium]|nr:SCO family protein [Alphaproteobacteria bacterium]MBF0250053.1 SCO family protein [Alphaproteobacteria bacterium]